MIDNVKQTPLTEYLHNKAAINRIPLNGTFELTPVCNLNCKMCYVRMSPEEQKQKGELRSVDEWINLAREAKKHGLTYLLITGGEPFLYPEIEKLLTEVNRLGMIVSINTNGTMIDQETINWLKKCPPFRLNITLYGASDKTYERLCGNPSGFTRVMEAIDLLQNEGFTVKLNYSVTPYNKDDLFDALKIARGKGLIMTPTTYLFPQTRKDALVIGDNPARLDASEAALLEARIKAFQFGEEQFVELVNNNNFDRDNLLDDCIEVTEGEGIRCKAGRASFWIDWRGNMSFCGMIPGHLNNVFEKPFLDCWNEIVTETNLIRLPVECANCNLKEECKPCAAIVYSESGSYNKVPKYKCLYTKKYREHLVATKEEIVNRNG